MTGHYLDPSAWIKRYFEETGSRAVASIFQDAESIVCLKHEEDLANLPIAVMVLMAKTNRLADLLPFAPLIETELVHLRQRVFSEVVLP